MQTQETIYLPDLGECKQGPNPDSLPRCIQNQKQRAKIRTMAQEHGQCWLVQVNGYNNNGFSPLTLYRFGLPCNFAACAIVPTYDAELVRMIAERATAPYIGTADDGKRIDAIFDRIEAIGGTVLLWR